MTRKIFYLVGSLLLIAMALTDLYLLCTPYDSLIHTIVSNFQKSGLEQKLRTQVLTAQRFSRLRVFAWVFLFLLPCLGWLLYRLREYFIERIGATAEPVVWATRKVIRVFQTNSAIENATFSFLLIIVTVFHLLHILKAYPTYDETWSFNYFTAHPLYVLVLFSNYPLFEVSTVLFRYLPFPMIVNIRLSSLVFGLMGCIVIYAYLRKYFNSHFVACIAMATFAFMPLSVDYMANGRGVMHGLFFSIISIFSLVSWLEHSAGRRFLYLYFLAGVWGIFSMPTQGVLLAFLFFVGWFFLRGNTMARRRFWRAQWWIIVFSLLLYLPMIIASGNATLSGVQNELPDLAADIQNLWRNLSYLFGGFVGVTWFSAVFFILVVGFLLVTLRGRKDKKPFAVITTWLLPATLLGYFLTGSLLGARSLAFGGLAVPMMSALVAEQLDIRFRWPRTIKLTAAGLALGVAIAVEWNLRLPVYPLDKQVSDLAGLFVQKNISTCYDHSTEDSHFFYYYPGIEFQYRLLKRPFTFTLGDPRSMRYKAFDVADRYDAVVYDMGQPLNAHAPYTHLIYTDPAGKFQVFSISR